MNEYPAPAEYEVTFTCELCGFARSGIACYELQGRLESGIYCEEKIGKQALAVFNHYLREHGPQRDPPP